MDPLLSCSPSSATRPTGSMATHCPRRSVISTRPHLDLDANNSTSGGVDYRAEVTNDRTPVRISDTDSDIDDFDGGIITFAQITINSPFPGDVLSVIGTLPFGIVATPFNPFTGTLWLFGFGSHSDYETAIEQIGFSTDAPVGVTKSIAVWVFDDFWWSNEAHAIFTVTSAGDPPDLDLDANNSTGFGVDASATYRRRAAVPVTDTDVRSPMTARRSSRRRSTYSITACTRRHALHLRHAADRHHGIELQRIHRHHHAQRLGVARRLSDRAAPGGLQQHATPSTQTATSRCRSTTASSRAISRRCTCTS